MRQLIYVPVIHSVADMGSVAEPLRREFTDQFGVCVWKEHIKAVDEMWEGIVKRLGNLSIDHSKARIYQDGLPVCGREFDIVRGVAAQGSQNHRLVLSLVKRGAALEGTEDVRLLLKEYHYIQAIAKEPDAEKKRKKVKLLNAKRSQLLRQRDQFMARQIASTLKEGETGILFAGLSHRIDKYLPKDIRISYLIFRLPFKKLCPK
jgi:hypothetical protein